MKPICVPCERFYRPEKNGLYFREGKPRNGQTRVPPGTSHSHLWADYKLWCGDLWKCHGCGNTIIVGTGLKPLRYDHDPDFKEVAKDLRAFFRVNDC